MQLNKNDIIEYIINLNFDDGYNLIRDLVSIINTKTSERNNHQLNYIESNFIQYYMIDVSIKDIRENVNIGSFLLSMAEERKQAEYNFANSLDWHTRIQYDKFHKEIE